MTFEAPQQDLHRLTWIDSLLTISPRTFAGPWNIPWRKDFSDLVSIQANPIHKSEWDCGGRREGNKICSQRHRHIWFVLHILQYLYFLLLLKSSRSNNIQDVISFQAIQVQIRTTGATTQTFPMAFTTLLAAKAEIQPSSEMGISVLIYIWAIIYNPKVKKS